MATSMHFFWLMAGGYALRMVSQGTFRQITKVVSAPFTSGPKLYYRGGFESVMTRPEASRILGVRQTASKDKITKAHRKLMALNHPDTGGSAYMATKINEAKKCLMQGAEKSG
mmetsp:Transcript_16621/g.25865  ORF Transcript_16621/g.25865 Transcript_16621/m.25865 type:complete len:113 (-) Transcript_16621:193-531(-)